MNMENEQKRLVWRYAHLTIKNEVNPLKPDEASEREWIGQELGRQLGLTHQEIIEFACKNLIEEV